MRSGRLLPDRLGRRDIIGPMGAKARRPPVRICRDVDVVVG